MIQIKGKNYEVLKVYPNRINPIYLPAEISRGQYFADRTEGAIYNRASEIRRGKYE